LWYDGWREFWTYWDGVVEVEEAYRGVNGALRRLVVMEYVKFGNLGKA